MNRMKHLLLWAVLTFFVNSAAGLPNTAKPLQVGWAVGDVVDDETGTHTIGPSILHTRNGGGKWVEQGNTNEWPGYAAVDVSAVDKLTAWVALSGPEGQASILHTTNGGLNWVEQTLPDGVVGGMKQVKGLSRREAWAASLWGTVLHTTDGGETWNIVDTIVPITQVNRIDVIGYVDPHDVTHPAKNQLMSNADIWIVDEQGGDQGMVHSLDNGENWRKDDVPLFDNGMHMVSAYSPQVVWAATTQFPYIYRTLDGGETWDIVSEAGAPNDHDDMCAASQDTVWTVFFEQSSGSIFHVRVFEAGDPEVLEFKPDVDYRFGGITCVDDQTALVVGDRGAASPLTDPAGIIVSTTDGGEHWARHSIPDNVTLWKTSFVGARR